MLLDIAPPAGTAATRTRTEPLGLLFGCSGQLGGVDLDLPSVLPGEDRFSAEATSALEEMTRGVALMAQVNPPPALTRVGALLASDDPSLFLVQVSNYDNNTGLPIVHLWKLVSGEVCLVGGAAVGGATDCTQVD